MNINTLVEMIIAFQETHDWRATFERCIPLRKLDVEDETGNGFDYHNIHSAEALEAISEYQINRYQMKHALHILCEKRGLKYAFETQEVPYEEHEEGKAFLRFRSSVTVEGKVLGEGRGKNQRSAQGKAAWHALVALGDITTSYCVSCNTVVPIGKMGTNSVQEHVNLTPLLLPLQQRNGFIHSTHNLIITPHLLLGDHQRGALQHASLHSLHALATEAHQPRYLLFTRSTVPHFTLRLLLLHHVSSTPLHPIRSILQQRLTRRRRRRNRALLPVSHRRPLAPVDHNRFHVNVVRIALRLYQPRAAARHAAAARKTVSLKVHWRYGIHVPEDVVHVALQLAAIGADGLLRAAEDLVVVGNALVRDMELVVELAGIAIVHDHIHADQHVEREPVPIHQVPVQIAFADRLVAHLGELHHHQVALVVHQYASPLIWTALLNRLQQHVCLVLDTIADEEWVTWLRVKGSGRFNSTGSVINTDHVKKFNVLVLKPLAERLSIHLVAWVEQRLEHTTRAVGIHGNLGKSGKEKGTLVRLRMMMRPCWSRQGKTPWVKKITSSSERPKK